MKKVTALFLLLACMLAGCGQKETMKEAIPTSEAAPISTQKTTPMQGTTPTKEVEFIPIIQTSGGAPTPTVAAGQETEDGVFRYEASAGPECFAVDEEGLLYTIAKYPTQTSPATLKIYDWDGNCIKEHVLEIGIEKVKHLLVGENYLYLLIPETDCANVLYRIDRTTWEAKRLYDFTEFENIFDMVLLGDTMYVLAEYENYKDKEFINYQDWYFDSNGRDYIVASLKINEETLELVFVPVDLPMYIFAVNEDTLGIYENDEEYTYRLFAYSSEDNTFQEISASYSTGEDIYRRPFQYYEDGIFMVYNWDNIYYVSKDGTEHELLQMDNQFYARSSGINLYNRKIIYVNGYLFYQELYTLNIARNIIERVQIQDKLEEILQAE